jgi:hypothetical protein
MKTSATPSEKKKKLCNHFHLNHQVKLSSSGLFFLGSFQIFVLLLPPVVDLHNEVHFNSMHVLLN